MSTLIKVNGQSLEVDAEPDTPLLWVLRGELHQNGSKFGCGLALCGACTVHLDGEPVRACVTHLADVGQRAVTTIEGVTGPQIDALRQAWIDLDVVQCGYCQSGQLMCAADLLRRIPKPSDADIDQAMNGNLCRCGTYPRVRQAIHQAAKSK